MWRIDWKGANVKAVAVVQVRGDGAWFFQKDASQGWERDKWLVIDDEDGEEAKDGA